MPGVHFAYFPFLAAKKKSVSNALFQGEKIEDYY